MNSKTGRLSMSLGSGRPRLPFWLNTLLLAFVPIVVLGTVDTLFVSTSTLGTLIGTYGVLVLLVVYFFYAARFIRTRVDSLNDYAMNLAQENRLGLHLSSSWPGIILTWLGLIGVNIGLFGAPNSTTFFSEQYPVFMYFFLVFAFFLWTYAYAMLAIYRAGKLHFQLRPFTEDRTLGLKPFGTTSLKLVSVYAVFPIIVTIVQLLSIDVDAQRGLSVTLIPLRPSDIIFIAGLVLAGLGLFFLPLLSIHRRLLEAKRTELAWVNPEYTKIVHEFRQEIVSENRGRLAQELTAIRQVQSDVQRIPSWPFDIGIVVRLATILILPPILGVIARILVLVFLHL